jgi:hypothetical protein
MYKKLRWARDLFDRAQIGKEIWLDGGINGGQQQRGILTFNFPRSKTPIGDPVIIIVAGRRLN